LSNSDSSASASNLILALTFELARSYRVESHGRCHHCGPQGESAQSRVFLRAEVALVSRRTDESKAYTEAANTVTRSLIWSRIRRNELSRVSSSPSTAAGSSKLQWILCALQWKTGQVSFALSQTVTM